MADSIESSTNASLPPSADSDHTQAPTTAESVVQAANAGSWKQWIEEFWAMIEDDSAPQFLKVLKKELTIVRL